MTFSVVSRSFLFPTIFFSTKTNFCFVFILLAAQYLDMINFFYLLDPAFLTFSADLFSDPDFHVYEQKFLSFLDQYIYEKSPHLFNSSNLTRVSLRSITLHSGYWMNHGVNDEILNGSVKIKLSQIQTVGDEWIANIYEFRQCFRLI